jgi:hypothetical protein
MCLGNGQTQRVTQSFLEDCRCVTCAKREKCFTLVMSGDHQGGEKFFLKKFLKDLGL